jgi:lysine 2,3-aminomutase
MQALTDISPQIGDGRGAARPRYIRDLSKLEQIPAAERELLAKVAEKYAFRINDYYLRLIDWSDPLDPIRAIVIPRAEELNDWGELDASHEKDYTVARGVQHKYRDTVLLLCNEVCGAYCRYCFRKRLFMDDNDEVSNDVSEGIAYIAAHPEVTNVLLTGGDPLLLSTRRLVEILSQLRAIPHVRIIRIGSKMPAFAPGRVLDDPELQAAFRQFSTPDRRIYLMCHFDHPRELTESAVAGIDCLLRNHVICTNQCPIVRGVNDDPAVLAELFARLSFIGCPQYYLFQGRPTQGNEPYEVPLVRGWQIYSRALQEGSGLARRPRFVMSHATGKIEVLAVDDRHIYLRYHSASDPANSGRFAVYHRDDEAYWFDQLRAAEGFEHLAAPRGVPAGDDVPRFALSAEERALLAQWCAELGAEGADRERLVAGCRERGAALRSALPRLAARIGAAMRDGCSEGLLRLIDLPDGVSPEALSLLLAGLLGEPVREHAQGPWIKEIKVDEEFVYSRPSARDAREFFLHTDLSYSSSPPPFFLLHSLVNSPSNGGMTTLCPLAGLLGRLSEEAVRQLALPQFLFPVPSYYPGDGPVTSAVLQTAPDGSRWIRFRRDGLRSTTWAGMAAVGELLDAIVEQSLETHLESGSVLLIDNRRWLHGRTAFLPAAGRGEGRHLHQVYAE